MVVCLGTTPVYQRTMAFERVTPDAVNRAKGVRDYASGKGVNVARVLRALGADAVAVGFAGGDRGAALCRDLDAAGVRHEFVPVPAETRQCVTVIDRSSGAVTELVEESAPVGPAAWAALDAKLGALLPKAAAWAFSGSLPPGAPQDAYARWLPAARDASRPGGPPFVLIDARGEPLRLALRHGGFVAKVNREELAATVGTAVESEAQLRDAMRRALPAGGWVVVTLGADGSVGFDGQRFWRVRPVAVKVNSPIGSGDSFAAGLVAAKVRGARTLGECLPLAAACGAANAMTADSGSLNTHDVKELLTRVEVEEIRTAC